MSLPSLRVLRFVCFFLALAGTVACSKKHNGNGPDVKPQEQGLVLKLDGVSESTPTAAPGETYGFSVGVTSAMPAEGVTVKVTVTTISGTDVPQPAIPPQTTAPINITLVGLPDLKTCNVTITITSQSDPRNTVTKTFQITNKA